MRIITFAAQKGGVGKTTLAVNLAVAAEARGIRTTLADLDPQESACCWGERRTAGIPIIEPVSARRLPVWLASARDAGFDLAILDTPPAAGTEAIEAAKLADLILIPCSPSFIDLEAIRTTARLVAMVDKPAWVILNRASPGARLLIEQASQLVVHAGLAVAPAVIRERSDWRHAWPLGLGVGELRPPGKAAAELDELLRFILATLPDLKGNARGKKQPTSQRVRQTRPARRAAEAQ